MTELCDMHCHILPGIDDGAETMEETMQALRAYASQNVTQIIVTPHYYPDRYTPEREKVLWLLSQVQSTCEAEKLSIRLYAGQECYYHTELAEKLRDGRALTLAGSRYVLVEFDPMCAYSYLKFGLRDLQNSGFYPILAHFERYPCLDEEERLCTLKDMGILLQMNFEPLRQRNRFLRKNPWRILVKKGLVDYLGTDCHGMNFRPPWIQEAIGWIERELDPALADQILHQNIKNILIQSN
jgi:protein-tyrosine phosphatase